MDSAPTLKLLSLPSRSFTEQESSRISALYQGLASSLLRKSLLSASAMPPVEKSGAGVVVAPQDFCSTMAIITPCGTLLLSLKVELDAFSAELVMSFTKVFMEGVPEVDTQPGRIKELEEVQRLLYALREIAENSEDAESVRVAFSTLTDTSVGQSYMRENPIKL